MKKQLLIIFTISFFSASAQKKPTFFRRNPYKKATLYLRNGDTINGIIKVNSFNKIIFKETEKTKKIKYDYKKVKGLTLHLDSINRHYQYKIIREEKFRGKVETYYHLLELVKTGNVSVYIDDYEAYRGDVLKKNIGYTSYFKDHRFYISKGKSDIVTPLGRITSRLSLFELGPDTTIMGPGGVIEAGGKLFDFKFFYTNSVYKISDLEIKLKSKYFKKIIEKYFSDCKELVSRIETGFYKKNDLLPILNYYNEECEK